MRILKSHSLLKLVNSYLIDASQPSNISYLWNFGSLLAVCLVIQIITGVTLAMHYSPNVLEAFNSIEHIMRDVNNGWLIRYLHSNAASAFFFLVYLHIGRGMYYGSYKAPRTLVWVLGVVILIAMIVTGFLGYWYSPKWHELFLNISWSNIFLFFNNIISHNIFMNIYTSIFIFSFVLFYLDSFRLSNINLIRSLQRFSFISFPFIVFILAYNHVLSLEILNCIKDNENNINLHTHGHVSIDKEASKAIGQGLNTIGSQWGLGGTIVGVSTVVGKAVAKSGIPPLQKAGFIVGSGLVAGLGHSAISTLNRRSIYEDNTNITASVSNTNIGSHINKLINDSNISPLEELLFNGEMMSYVCLGILYLLIIQLVFKLYFKENINLKLSKLLGNSTNIKIEFYLNKIIKLNKRMSVLWIWFGSIIIMFGLSINTYVLRDILVNLDSYINIHSRFNPAVFNDICITHMSNNSIQDILLNEQMTHYISIIALILLMLQIILKFHYNKNIKNIFIWLMLLILIVTLAFSAYTYGDLYTHINDYINMYINLKNK